MTADAERVSHTPGPWTADDNADVHPASDPDAIIAWVSSPNEIAAEDEESQETMANARLISAAPDMAELLRELIDIEGPQPGTNAWAKKVGAVLAKIEGRDV